MPISRRFAPASSPRTGLWCGQNEKWWIMERSRDQFGPEGPEVSTSHVALRLYWTRLKADGCWRSEPKVGSPRTEPIVRRLRAGGGWIRNFSSAMPRHRQQRGHLHFGRVSGGSLSRRNSSIGLPRPTTARVIPPRRLSIVVNGSVPSINILIARGRHPHEAQGDLDRAVRSDNRRPRAEVRDGMSEQRFS